LGASDASNGPERSTTGSEATPVPGAVRTPPAALPRRLHRILALDDFEAAARRHLPRPMFGYVAGAAETNASLRDNRLAFEEFGFVPRVLVDVSKRTQRVELFGMKMRASELRIAPVRK